MTNLNDSGPGSLRVEIQQANADPGPDTIAFSSALTGNIPIKSPLEFSDATGLTTVQGPDDTVLSVVGAGTNGFVVDPGSSAIISGLDISGMSRPFPVTGGGILNAGTLTVVACSFSYNQAHQGAAIGNNGTLNVIDSTFGRYANGSNNLADSGGAIFNAGSLTLAGCLFWNNQATVAGGAIANSGGTLAASNCTFAGNRAGTQGGAMINSDSATAVGSVRLTNCTVFGDVAPSGGGIYNNGTAVELNNTIAAANTTTPNGAPSDVSGTIRGDFNLIGAGGSGGLLDGGDGNRVGLTPDQLHLAALGDYGGPTMTMLPTPGSPAIDAGSNSLAISPNAQALTSDQRGLPRMAGAAVDIGAAEFQTVPVNTVKDGVPFPLLAPGEFSIRSAVDTANATPGPDEITFDPAVFAPGSLHTIVLQTPLVFSDTTGETNVSGLGSEVLAIRVLLAGRDFTLQAGADVALSGLAITGGVLGSGAHTGGIANSGSLILTRCNLAQNTPSDSGGAIHNFPGASLTATDCTFTNNSAAGIYNQGSATLTRCTLSGNSSAGYGGAILNAGMLIVKDSSFTGNSTAAASQLTGGAALCNEGTGVVTGCTFSGNSAAASSEGDGGAVYNPSGFLTISNSTFTGNSAQDYGGAIDNRAALSLVQCTITGNGGLNGNGIHTTTTVAMDNSIAAGNHSGGPSVGYDTLGPAQGSSNLIGTASPDGLTNGVDGNIVGVADPKLGPLGNYGGPTQTIPLLSGSPALEAGSNALAVDGSGNPLTIDQRGLSRIFNGTVDIGAYEAQPPALSGDVNHDGKVDFSDLLILAQRYGSTTQPLWEGGDLTGDGSVAFPDLLVLAQNYGHSATAAAASSLDMIRHSGGSTTLVRRRPATVV